MDQDELVRQLEKHRDAEARIGANLVELEEHPTYRLLAAGDMGGLTGRRMNEHMAKSQSLWMWLAALRTTLDHADDLVEEAGGRWDADERRAIGSVLLGPSVTLTTSGGAIEGRDLLGVESVDTSVTIDQLIAQMRRAYEPIRDGVAAVDQVWREFFPRIDAATTSLDEADAIVADLGVHVPILQQARQRLDAVRSTVADDPLSLSDRVGPDLDRLVDEAVQEVARHERSHRDLDADLAEVARLVAELRRLRARAAAAWSEAHAKVRPEDHLVRVPGPAVIDGDGGLADRAGAFHAAGLDWRTVRREMDEWMTTAARLRDQLRRAEVANRAPLEKREELRGRFRAYRVKLEATMRADEPEIAELVDRIHDQLYTRPTDLPTAEASLERLASALSA